MFARSFTIACGIVSTYYVFIPTFAFTPIHYFSKPRTPHEIAETYCKLYKRNCCVIKSVMKIESDTCTLRKSKAGAVGCMQLMPATARALGLRVNRHIDERDIAEDNIAVGTKHLFDLIDKHGLVLGLKIYNAGPKRVDKTPENRAYANKVLNELYKCKS